MYRLKIFRSHYFEIQINIQTLSSTLQKILPRFVFEICSISALANFKHN